MSLLLSAALTLAGYPILKKHVRLTPDGATKVSSDVLVYVDAARDLLGGKDIYKPSYPGEFPYVYPPFYALLNVPLVLVDPLVLDIAWYLLNVGLLCATIHLAFFLFTGMPFTATALRDQWLYAGLSIVFAARYLLRNAQQGNVNLFILFLVILSLYMLRRTGRAHWASLAGIAAAIKVFPCVIFLYFLGKRQFRELGFAISALLAATFLPSLAVGFTRNWEYLQSFSSCVQRRLSPEGVAVENFSLWGTLGRVLSKQVAFTLPGKTPSYVNVANLDLQILKYIVYAINLLFMVLVYRVSQRRERFEERPRPSSGGAIVVALLTMNLASVLIEDHHTVAYLVAHLYLLIAWRAKAVNGGAFVALMFGAGIMSNLISHDVIVPVFGKQAYLTCQAFSLPVLPVGIILLSLTLYCMFKRVQLLSWDGHAAAANGCR